MQVVIQPDREAVALLVANVIAHALRRKPSLVLGLATGRTQEIMYAELVRLHREEGLDFSLCRTFNLDEYVGLGPDDPHSYRYYMDHNLFHHVNIDPRNTHVPRGLARDLEEECRQYETRIKDCGGIDLQVLGIGIAGHIGFNEPLSSLASRTREKALTPTTLRQNAPLFDKPEDMPKRGITMGVATILKSKRCIMIATGAEKATIIAKAVEGPITSMVTASALQLHTHCQVFVDEAAAAQLQETEYYRWIFDNEPEWAPFR